MLPKSSVTLILFCLTFVLFSSKLFAVREFSSVRAGFEHSPDQPFIVRNAPEFSAIPMSAGVSCLENSKACVFGYEGKTFVENLLVSVLLQQWRQDSLAVKVLDSPMHVVNLPSVFDEFDQLDKAKDWEHGQSPILTRSQAYTGFHVDPPNNGGGWMYLWQGQKKWNFISQKMISKLSDKSGEIADLSADELAQLVPEAELSEVTANAGDFIYFPPGWIHRVWTFEKAIGLGGYILLEGAKTQMQEAMAQL